MRVFWTAEDLAVWLGLALPSLWLGGMLGRLIPVVQPLQQLYAQFLFFLIWFLLLKLLFRLKYEERFWRALGWVLPGKGLWLCLLMGPILAVGLNLLAQWLKAQPVDPPFKDVLFDRRYRYLFGVASVVAAPLCEELAFRGFLMPLFAKWLGIAGGIVVTGAIFGSAHGKQYGWMWQYVVLLTVAGSIFGLARWRYASTMASMVLHSSFNLTVFLARIYG
jgi:membrane protease YdiL (CAAX protease family)